MKILKSLAMYILRRWNMLNEMILYLIQWKCQVSKKDTVVNYKDWQISLSRRFRFFISPFDVVFAGPISLTNLYVHAFDLYRSLKLWMVLRLYGSENLRNFIRDHVNLAKHFEDYVAQDPSFEVIYTCEKCFRTSLNIISIL